MLPGAKMEPKKGSNPDQIQMFFTTFFRLGIFGPEMAPGIHFDSIFH